MLLMLQTVVAAGVTSVKFIVLYQISYLCWQSCDQCKPKSYDTLVVACEVTSLHVLLTSP